MELEINGTLDKIVVGATGRQEIIQNVKTILSTVKGTVMLDRTFGLSGEYVDAPGPVLEARLAREVVEEALQIHGGNGLTKEYYIEKLWRDSRAMTIEDGDNTTLNRLGGHYLKETFPRKKVDPLF